MQFIQIRNTNYSVSRYGEVRNDKKGKILKGTLNSKGYQRVYINGKRYFIHRLVGQAYIPNPLQLPQINHIDKNKLNNHYTNLEWCTNQQNTQHSIDNDRANVFLPGEKHINAKLTQQQALDIKSSSLKPAVLANMYNVSAITIYKIKQGKMWKHLL